MVLTRGEETLSRTALSTASHFWSQAACVHIVSLSTTCLLGDPEQVASFLSLGCPISEQRQ